MAIGWLLAVNAVRAGEKWALVIGVNDCPEFRLADGSRPRPLRGAETDAEAVSTSLAGQFGFKTSRLTVLLGRQATLASVRAALTQIARMAGPDDTVVFYFSGHGTQARDQRPVEEEDGLDEALCCYDGTADVKSLLLDDELGRWLDELRASDVTIVLDSCHSGTATKAFDDDLASRYLPLQSAVGAVSQSTAPWSELKPSTKSLTVQRRIALFACRPEQQAYERRFPGQQAPARSGQFTRYLLDGLRQQSADADGDRQVTGAEAMAYVKRRLDESFNASRSEPVDRQEPLMELTGADIPLFSGRK
jgi:uncharacterized caspase-like protein